MPPPQGRPYGVRLTRHCRKAPCLSDHTADETLLASSGDRLNTRLPAAAFPAAEEDEPPRLRLIPADPDGKTVPGRLGTNL